MVSTPSIVLPFDRGKQSRNVGEVDHEGAVCFTQAERVRIAVGSEHAQAERPRLLDRAPLMAPGADEEDGLHDAMLMPAAVGEPGSGARADDVSRRGAACC